MSGPMTPRFESEQDQEMEVGDWVVIGIYFAVVFAVGIWVTASFLRLLRVGEKGAMGEGLNGGFEAGNGRVRRQWLQSQVNKVDFASKYRH